MREVIVYSDEMGIEWDDLLPRNIRENGIYSFGVIPVGKLMHTKMF